MIAMARVLLVEDEEALSRLISWSLLDAGHEVGVVATPAAAVERLSTYRAEVIVFNTVIAHEAKDASKMELIAEPRTVTRIIGVALRPMPPHVREVGVRERLHRLCAASALASSS